MGEEREVNTNQEQDRSGVSRVIREICESD